MGATYHNGKWEFHSPRHGQLKSLNRFALRRLASDVVKSMRPEGSSNSPEPAPLPDSPAPTIKLPEDPWRVTGIDPTKAGDERRLSHLHPEHVEKLRERRSSKSPSPS